MRFPRCCCFTSSQSVLDEQDDGSIAAVRQGHHQSSKPKQEGSTTSRTSYWLFKRRRNKRDAQAAGLLGTQSGNVDERNGVVGTKAATAAAFQSNSSREGKTNLRETSITASSQQPGHRIPEKEPLITSAEAKARLTDAVLPPPISTLTRAQGTSQNSLAVVPLPEGFELSPFSPDVRWRKDRNARKLSSGATAIVYRAEKVVLDGQHATGGPSSLPDSVPVAVKAVNLDKHGNQELAEHEGSVLSGLNGKSYVPRYHGLYQDPPTRHWHRRAYIVTGLLPGMNLDDLCYRVCRAHARCKDSRQVQDLRQWVWGLAVQVVYQMAQALEDTHRDRSHRDLKSGNVMVSDWDGKAPLRVHLVDWANSRLHTEEHLLNEYCTPEYSSPQLIAAITSLPAPVMDDAANDMWSLGVIFFQMLMNTIPGRQMPFDATTEQSRSCGREELLKEIQKTVQQQHDEWAAVDSTSVGSKDACLQPWQLTALQESADFSDSSSEAADRCKQVVDILSGLLEVDDSKRWTAQQLAACSWLQDAAARDIGPCPLQL